MSVLLANGNGTFHAQQTFAAAAGPLSVAVGDVNGDAIPDLVTANGSYGSVSVLLGNGDGTFQAPQAFAAGQDTFFVVLGDLTGDGKSDIVVGDEQENAVSVVAWQWQRHLSGPALLRHARCSSRVGGVG